MRLTRDSRVWPPKRRKTPRVRHPPCPPWPLRDVFSSVFCDVGEPSRFARFQGACKAGRFAYLPLPQLCPIRILFWLKSMRTKNSPPVWASNGNSSSGNFVQRAEPFFAMAIYGAPLCGSNRYLTSPFSAVFPEKEKGSPGGHGVHGRIEQCFVLLSRSGWNRIGGSRAWPPKRHKTPRIRHPPCPSRCGLRAMFFSCVLFREQESWVSERLNRNRRFHSAAEPQPQLRVVRRECRR